MSPYNLLDVRGSYTVAGYKRAEAEFVAPRLFHRRGTLSLLGGWREATQVGFYGLGMDTSKDDRTNYRSSSRTRRRRSTFWPTRRLLMLRGGVELVAVVAAARRGQLPLGRDRVHARNAAGPRRQDRPIVHSQGTVGLDWRTSPGYSRRGGFYGVTVHDYADSDERVRLPAGRLRGDPALPDPARSLGHLAPRAGADHVQQGRSADPVLHAAVARRRLDAARFSSWRFRDRNSLLLQAEWRIMVNRFIDTAVFYDAGKVAARTSDLDLHGAEERLRLRASASTARSPRRCASSWPGAMKACRLIFASSAIF